jgi:hypothetical protein
VGAWRPGRRAGKLGGEGNEQPKANDRMTQNNNKPPAEASPKFDVAARSTPAPARFSRVDPKQTVAAL